VLLQNLAFDGIIPSTYIDWRDTVRKLCLEVVASEEFQRALAKLKLGLEKIQET
jgi:hypothetical protein